MFVAQLRACAHLDPVAPGGVVTDEGHDNAPTGYVDLADARNRRDRNGRDTQEDEKKRSTEYRSETVPQEDQSARLLQKQDT